MAFPRRSGTSFRYFRAYFAASAGWMRVSWNITPSQQGGTERYPGNDRTTVETVVNRWGTLTGHIRGWDGVKKCPCRTEPDWSVEKLQGSSRTPQIIDFRVSIYQEFEGLPNFRTNSGSDECHDIPQSRLFFIITIAINNLFYPQSCIK